MESIKETLAKNQQGHSQTSNEPVCIECGKLATPGFRRLCDDCRGKLAVRQEQERRQEAEKKLAEEILNQGIEWSEASNLPGKFYGSTFENFDAKFQPKAFAAVKSLKWQWDDDGDDPPQSLVLLSPGIYGVGKTHLVCALMNHIIVTEEKARLTKYLSIQRLHCPVYFVSENELLRRIRNTYNRSSNDGAEKEEDVYSFLKQFSLLIIDDAGKVRPRDLNFLQGVYFNLIDQRYNDEQPIILTTNLDLSELEQHIGGACADRIREMASKNGIITMSGKSYRQR